MIFSPVRYLLKEGDIDTIRFCLTCLQVSRVIKGNKPIDIESIIKPGVDISVFREEYRSYLPEVLEGFNISKQESLPYWTGYHVSTTLGPSGPSMLRASSDLVTFGKEYSSLLGALGADELLEDIETYPSQVQEVWDSVYPPRFNTLRRLTTIPDNEGKTRVIAIFDFISQSILKVLHDKVMNLIKGIKIVDLTYDQDIAPFGSSEHQYHSFDLTSATDRFPVDLQVDLLTYLYNEDYAKAWKELMVSKPFLFDSKEYKYSVGQPMGAYSSWAVFSLCHHTIVQIAARKAGFTSHFTDYRLLGDDIVIRHDLVAAKYKEIVNSLGVDIGSAKTLISKETFEFAKRMFYKEREVTAYPSSGAISTIKRWIDFTQVLLEGSRRGYPNLVLSFPLEISKLYINLAKLLPKEFPYGDKFYSRLVRKMYSLSMIHRDFNGIEVFKLLSLWNISLSCNVTEQSLKDILLDLAGRIKYKLLFRDLRKLEKVYTDFSDRLKDPKFSKIPSYLMGKLPLMKALLSSGSDREDFKFNLDFLLGDCLEGNLPFSKIYTDAKPIRVFDINKLDSSRKMARDISFESSLVLLVMVALKDVERSKLHLVSLDETTEFRPPVWESYFNIKLR